MTTGTGTSGSREGAGTDGAKGATGGAEAPHPLTPEEERAWRALARAVVVLPRVLESELVSEQRLTLAEYMVLVMLSEEPGWALRISDLAVRANLSVSGMSRVVDRLATDGLVERAKCPSDARGAYAVLTDAGLARLEAAYPTHLRGVRRHVIDQLAGLDLQAFADAVQRFAGGAECSRHEGHDVGRERP